MAPARHGRLFLRLALTLGGALTVAFALAASLSIGVGTHALGESVEQELNGVAHIVHLGLERFLAARRAELQLCSEVEAMDDVFLDDSHFRIQNELMRVARNYPDIYDEIAVVNLAGQVVASTRVERIGTPLSVDGLKLLENRDGSRIGQGPQVVTSAPQPVFVMAHAVRSSLSKETSGWLVALVRWSAVSEVIQGTSVVGQNQAPGAFMVLLRGTQPIAGHTEWLPGRMSRDTRRLIRNRALRHEDPRHYRGDESFVELTSGNRPEGWHVVFYRDAREAFRAVRWFAWSVLAAGILGLLVAALLSLGAAREFTRRVSTLTQGTQRLAAGDYAHRIVDRRDDELAELGESFNQMAVAVQGARQRHEEQQAELEDNNRRLREASKLKDEFLANTSHELRTPLNGILGFLELVNDDLCSTPEEERQFVGQALACGKHLLTLIEDVLDVSHIESGRLALMSRAVPVSQAFARITSELGPRARTRGLVLRCEPPTDAALAVCADEQRLHQVLRHLVDNAIKFTEHGSVTIRCVVPEAAGHVRFEVRDTGVGVALERQDTVFERFVQGDGSATRRFGGTGLGLSLVRDLVQLMGGVVQLESAGEGRGTSVHFTLPASGSGTAAHGSAGDLPAPDDQLLGPGSGPLALIVEDDPALTTWLRALLHADGFRTAWADSAERAWLLVRKLRPAVVLLDHALPAAANARLRTGAELARHMAASHATAGIPVVVLSGHDLVALEGERVLPKGTASLRKPVQPDVLLFELRRRLAAQRPRPLRVMLAHHDARLVALVSRAFPAEQFQVSIERNDDSCLEAVRHQPRQFGVVLLEAPADTAVRAQLLRGFAALPTAPPLVMLAEAGLVADRAAAAALRTGPVLDVFSKADVMAEPRPLLARLLALGSAAARPDSDAARAA